MPSDQRKQLVRQLIEAVTRTGNTARMRQYPGLLESIPHIERTMLTLTDRSVSFPLQFVEGEWVATRGVWRGTHTGNGYGIEPTGKQVEYEVLMLDRVVDGVIVEQHVIADVMGIMRQLGVTLPGVPQ